MSKWISVKDRLPNRDMSVLVCETHIEVTWWGGIQRGNTVGMEFWHNGDKRFCLYEKEWSTGICKKIKHRTIITHWMKQPDHIKDTARGMM